MSIANLKRISELTRMMKEEEEKEKQKEAAKKVDRDHLKAWRDLAWGYSYADEKDATKTEKEHSSDKEIAFFQNLLLQGSLPTWDLSVG